MFLRSGRAHNPDSSVMTKNMAWLTTRRSGPPHHSMVVCVDAAGLMRGRKRPQTTRLIF